MKQEIRYCKVNLIAVRDAQEDDLYALEGRVAQFNTLSHDLGGFKETIAPTAFERAIREQHDVVCNVQHDSTVILGRTKSGTLKLTTDNRGLNFRCQLDPGSSTHRDIHRAVKRGDYDEMSFAFSLPASGGDEWEEARDAENGQKYLLRRLKDVTLHDVSVVHGPAYPQGTGVDARATSDAAIDAFNRKRCAEIGQEIAADFQRRLEAIHRAVAADRAKGDI